MFVTIWEYEVRAGSEGDFVLLYGDHGAWVALFREYAGYIRTELLRDAARVQRFVTIDRWSSQAAYDAFLVAAKPRYAEIDALGDGLTSTEHCVGHFEPA